MFRIQNLSVLTYANNFTLWHYRQHGRLEEVTKPGFWHDASASMRQGDMILVSAEDSAAMLWVKSRERDVEVRALVPN